MIGNHGNYYTNPGSNGGGRVQLITCHYLPLSNLLAPRINEMVRLNVMFEMIWLANIFFPINIMDDNSGCWELLGEWNWSNFNKVVLAIWVIGRDWLVAAIAGGNLTVRILINLTIESSGEENNCKRKVKETSRVDGVIKKLRRKLAYPSLPTSHLQYNSGWRRCKLLLCKLKLWKWYFCFPFQIVEQIITGWESLKNPLQFVVS